MRVLNDLLGSQLKRNLDPVRGPNTKIFQLCTKIVFFQIWYENYWPPKKKKLICRAKYAAYSNTISTLLKKGIKPLTTLITEQQYNAVLHSQVIMATQARVFQHPNDQEEIGQWLWLNWQNGRIQHQRSASLAKIYLPILSNNCVIEKTKITKMTHL